jgi:hypothetical protein
VRVGDGQVFTCLCARAADRPDVSFWILNFYKSVGFGVLTWMDEGGRQQADSKTASGNGLGVRIPSPAPPSSSVHSPVMLSIG